MRRFFTTSFIILALVISAAGAAPAAHAGTGQELDACHTSADCDESHMLTCDANLQCTKPSVDSPPLTAEQKVAPAKTVSDAARTENASWGFDWIMAKIMSLFAWLVGIAALTLNYAMYYTVVDMGGYVTHLSAIGTVWRILRDIGNIMLIFGFLAIGISIIIDSEWYGGGKKLLPILLIAAIFTNFSLFAAEAVVDVGNLFATQIYKQINEGTLPNPSDASADTGFAAVIQKKGVAGVLMKRLGLPSIYGEMKGVDADGKPLFVGGAPFYMSFMSIIVFIVVAFVMFTLAFILVSRFIVLILLIMVSPIGVAGLAVPGLKTWADKWWHTLFQQTITAPILLLMLYIALSVIVDPKFLGFDAATPAWTGIQTGNVIGFAGILLSYLIAIGLLLAVVYFAKTLSAVGAGWATKMGGRFSFGAVSLGARATFGSAGNLLASKRMQDWSRTGKGKALRPLIFAGKALRSTTYDLRNAPGAAAGLGAYGIDAGKGATVTAKQAHDAQYGKKAVDAWFQKSTEEREQAGRDMAFKRAQKAIGAEGAALAAGTITQAQYEANIAPHEQTITNSLSRMSTKQLEELGGIKEGVEALVRNLSPEQFEGLMKSDKFTDIDKENMRENRYRSLNTAITGGTAADRAAVRQWSAKDIAMAAPGILNNPVQAASLVNLMSEGQFDAVVKNDKLSKSQQSQLRSFNTEGKINNYLDIANGVPPRTPALVTAGIIPFGMTALAANVEATRVIGTMSPKKLAKLHGSILTDPIAMSLFTPKHLAAFMTDGDLDPAEISTIAAAVRNPAHPNHVAIMSYLDPTTNPIAASYWL